ncbi:MAG: radical SAM/SPASM domain-containing protein [Nitrospinaceae bacterium]
MGAPINQLLWDAALLEFSWGLYGAAPCQRTAMLSIFVEASCNRYERDECVDCHVFEPLTPHFKAADWHLTPSQAQTMAAKIKQVDVLLSLARQEINLTGGEASQNPHIVDIFKTFKAVSPNVCLHTNLEIHSPDSPRWKRLVDIAALQGRIDITLYPSAWEKHQKPLLEKLLTLQDRLLANIVYTHLPNLLSQIELLWRFFQSQGSRFEKAAALLEKYHEKARALAAAAPDCREAAFSRGMGDIEAFAESPDFIFGINLLPAFDVDKTGRRSWNSLPFPHDPYLLVCPAVRGSIETMTIMQNGDMTPCCDVGNLKCQPKFGNLLRDTPGEIMDHFERSRQVMTRGVGKNQANMNQGRPGTWVEEGIPPYCV